jgi:nucleotide-binding universal stress UspA family protein
MIQQQSRLAPTAIKRLTKSVTDLTGRASAEFEILVECGHSATAIPEKAEKLGVDLIVAPPLPAVDRLIRHAHCPVLIIRGEPSRGPILAATDLSEPSFPAIVTAAEEARLRSRHLLVVFSLDLTGLLMNAPGSPVVDRDLSLPEIDDMTRSARQQLRQALQRAKVRGLPIVEYGSPVEAILRTAAEFGAGLIVVGAKGRSGVPRLLLGSVAEAVMVNANCSAMAVR